MPTATARERTDEMLAYELHGSGVPVVLLHGLTFDRRTWAPITERLGADVMSVAVDLPAHGESGGRPAPLDQVAERLHGLLSSLELERPVVVGHSISAGLAFLYASRFSTRGVVVVDQGLDVRPYGELMHRLEPLLRGPGFQQAWQPFEESLGLERIPEPTRSLVLATHRVEQEVVVGYWDELMRTDPAAFQARIDATIPMIDVPCLAVLGRPLGESDRERFERLAEVQFEDWTGDGHFVHLVDPARFAARLGAFVEHCSARI